MNSYIEAKKRMPTQREQILNKLRDAGDKGVTNTELLEIAIRYTARLHELYQQGYIIETVSINDGVYNYILKGEPEGETSVSAAVDILAERLNHEYSLGLDPGQLKELLVDSGLRVCRKSGSYKRSKSAV
ncbi:hypothetical protein [Metabacillus sp. Hm71]|uniref:hypothetical protein n=1 Tax=Metabacillus sp. Hm71 TaxID=3450743 RepID=UPI003F422D39